MLALAVAMHALAAAVWVGGMFFAYFALRPTLGAVEAPPRFTILAHSLGRFFRFVAVAIAVLFASGYWMVYGYFGGFGPWHSSVTIMHGIGWLMVVLFAFLWGVPYRRLRAAVDNTQWAGAPAAVRQIRWIVAVNLSLGLTVVAIGASGRYW